MSSLKTEEARRDAELLSRSADMYVTARVGPQLFGIPALIIQDVMTQQRVTPVPLAPREVAGSLNLRGRIVTVFDVRARLGLPPVDEHAGRGMNIVVEHHGELYALSTDAVGDVLTLTPERIDPNTATIDPRWRAFARGICQLEEELMVVLDVAGLLDLDAA